MSPESQRIAIAEACGWDEIEDCTCRVVPKGLPPNEVKGGKRSHLPDYLSDLNAMHEAEKVLTNEQKTIYMNETAHVIREKHWPGSVDEAQWLYHTATAAQRAEAFLKTLNLWTE